MSVVDLISVGQPPPRLRDVQARPGYAVSVTWDAAARSGTEVADLAPLIFRLEFYAPLRDDEALRATVHPVDDGTALAWGDGAVDMAITSVLDLAGESMEEADFAASCDGTASHSIASPPNSASAGGSPPTMRKARRSRAMSRRPAGRSTGRARPLSTGR